MSFEWTRLYRAWTKMKERCYNPHAKDFHRYGGRGIDVCDEWRRSFAAFESWALANGFKNDLSIDRRDNDKGYCPENCRWVDAKQQARNRSSSVQVTAWNETKTLIEWAEDPRCIVGYHTLRDRVANDVFGDVELMMTTPSKSHPLVTAWDETKSMSAWAKDPRCVVKKSTLRGRLYGGIGNFVSVEEMMTTPAFPAYPIRRGKR